jgi:hypothetical protein
VGIEVALSTPEGRGQVEPEPVDVHLADPIPQRVHDQPQALGLGGVERVAAAGVVNVSAPIVL